MLRPLLFAKHWASDRPRSVDYLLSSVEIYQFGNFKAREKCGCRTIILPYKAPNPWNQMNDGNICRRIVSIVVSENKLTANDWGESMPRWKRVNSAY